VPAGKVVLTIGDERITDKQFEAILDIFAQNSRQPVDSIKRDVAEQIARVKLLAQKARAEGLDKDVKYQAKLAFQAENMLAGAYFQEMQSKSQADDAALRKYYEDHKNEWENARARHILIRFKGSPVPVGNKKDLSEEEALAKITDIRKKIAGGEDFAKLAKEESDDQGSGIQGGDLGPFKRGTMVGPFDQAAFTLPVGELSEPVKTPFGYHLIKVESRDTKSFEEAKDEIAKRVKPEAAKQAIEDMRKNAAVVLDETYFGPPQPKVELMKVP
jgi:parvulin-like peptidyl-prolyl isomerase